MAMADKYREAYGLMGGTWRLFGDSPEYHAMRDAMSNMCNKLTELCTPDEHGQRPEYTREQHTQLRALQDQVVETCLAYMDGRKLEDIRSRATYTRFVAAQRVLKMVENDRRKMKHVDFSAHMTLRDVISRSRGSVERVDLAQARKESGSMNVRYYLPATETRKEGFFTPSFYVVSEDTMFKQAIEQTKESYLKYSTYIRFLTQPAKGLTYGIVQKNVSDTLHGAEKAEMELARDEDSKAFRDYLWSYLDPLKKALNSPRSRELNGLPAEWGFEEIMARQEFRAMLLDLRNGANHASNKFHILQDTGILVGRDIGKRNVAVSATAELLGLGELVASAKPMILVDAENGRELNGVFMEKARGLDLNRQNREPLFFARNIVWDTREAKLQLMSLQVIDWVCGNTDRHNANLFYDLQQGEDGVVRLMGVQGIDNDNSFGVKSVRELQESYGSEAAARILPTPETMGFIRRQDAMTILHLEQKDLNLRLFDLLEPDEIDSAWKRVLALQKAIMKSDGVNWKEPWETKRNVVRPMDDDQLSQIPASVYAFLPGLRRLVVVPKDLDGRVEYRTRMFGE